MNLYFSTFISGLQEIIDFYVKKYISDVVILKLFDGGILYKTKYRQMS